LQVFDQEFAEMLSQVLYQQVDLRTIVCQSLQRLVDSNKDRLALEEDESLALLRVSREQAESNLQHLQSFASNLLAVLFNTYTQTLPDYRGPILQCINTYLSIMSEQDIVDTFGRVSVMLEESLKEMNGSSKKHAQQNGTTKKAPMPPLSHTLMDLVITITSYLPRDNLAPLFNIAIIMLGKDDASLQKKAYKIIPRLAESEGGREALQVRNQELQNLILGSSESVLPAARHDRLLSIAKLIEYLTEADLHFIPTVIPEVTLCTRDHNEKARTAAYELMVTMGHRMAKGGAIVNAKIPHMPADAPTTSEASLEEFFTMASAGLAGTAPHTVAATISALSRITFEFKNEVKLDMIDELVETMDIFLKSPSREIVGAVLGFVKVSVVSLPSERLEKRLPTLVPNLLDWTGEHKAHVQAKVKHIFERLIRRYGVDKIERLTPEKDRKLIANIRKTKERRKKKLQQDPAADSTAAKAPGVKKFESNAYDDALYGSDEDNNSHKADSSSGSDVSDDEVLGKSSVNRKKKKGEGLSFIIEDATEPLDLLDSKSLARISSVKPTPSGSKGGQGIQTWRARAKYDADGKLILNDTESLPATETEQKEGGGTDAYMDAMKGESAGKRGIKGKIKFSNRRGGNKDDDGDEDGDPMEVDERDVAQSLKERQKLKRSPMPKSKPGRDGARRDKFSASPGKRAGGAGGFKGQKAQRRGLGVDKTRGGRIVKAGGRR
jgi:ribosomal RNA-processing protein 12